MKPFYFHTQKNDPGIKPASIGKHMGRYCGVHHPGVARCLNSGHLGVVDCLYHEDSISLVVVNNPLLCRILGTGFIFFLQKLIISF